MSAEDRDADPIEAQAAAEVRRWRRRMLRQEAEAGGVVEHGDMSAAADHAIRTAEERARRAFADDNDPARLALVLSIVRDLGDVARSIAQEADALAYGRDAAEAAQMIANATGGKAGVAATNAQQKAEAEQRRKDALAFMAKGGTLAAAAAHVGMHPDALGKSLRRARK